MNYCETPKSWKHKRLKGKLRDFLGEKKEKENKLGI